MKVKELLEKLQKADKEAEVVIRDDVNYKSVLIVSEEEAILEDWRIKFCVFDTEVEWDEDDKPLRYEHTL